MPGLLNYEALEPVCYSEAYELAPGSLSSLQILEKILQGLLPSSSLAELTLQTRSFLFTVSPHQMGQVSVFSHQGLLGNCNNPLYFSDSNEVASILS